MEANQLYLRDFHYFVHPLIWCAYLCLFSFVLNCGDSIQKVRQHPLSSWERLTLQSNAQCRGLSTGDVSLEDADRLAQKLKTPAQKAAERKMEEEKKVCYLLSIQPACRQSKTAGGTSFTKAFSKKW